MTGTPEPTPSRPDERLRAADEQPGTAEGRPKADELRCSARGCRNPALWALRWNNPGLHPPERRKTWLACDDHRESLSEFLARRGFLRETEPISTAT